MLSEPRNRARTGTLVLGACLVLTAPAQAQEQCIPASIERSLASCADTPALAPRARGTSALPRTQALPRTPTAPPTPSAPRFDLTPNDRAASIRRRELRLIEREIEVLERLAARTPPTDPRRAEVLHRLAETLGELASERERHARGLDEAVFQAQREHREFPLVRQRAEAERQAREARQRAARTLAELVSRHASDARAHEALYALAYHLTHLGQHEPARQAYVRLIRDYSGSRFVPHAYLTLAEHAFDERRLDDARELYERVLTIPPDRNPVYAYARYRLAWVHYNAEAHREALDELVRLLEHLRAHPDGAEAVALARQARRELVLPYAHVGAPDRALAFFRRLATDEDEAFGMLSRLGELYLDTGRWNEAIRVHHQLMTERPRAAELCLWQGRVLDATISARSPDEQLREAGRLLDVRTSLRTLGHPADVTRACDERTATSLVLLATAWHREAIGTPDQPGTRDRRTMARAAQLYARIERDLSELDALSLSDIAPADRPTRAHIAFFHAELLYETALSDDAQWAACARAYERALDTARDAQLASDAAYGAVLCYDRHLASRPPAETPRDELLTSRELTEDEARMARTFARFVCSAPSHEEIPTVLYRWARIHYEANQLDEAAMLFGRVAREHPRSDVAEYAANLYLDTVNMLATRRDRATCHTHLAESIGALESTYCGDEAARARHGELCPVVEFVRCDAEARAAAALGRSGQHREAAEAYVSLVRRRSCEYEDRYLFNAAIEYEAARLVGRAIRVRTALVEAFPASPLAQPSTYYVGANYHALAMYAQAADWYERFAREPACFGCADLPVGIAPPDVARALEHALTFRLGLADRTRALENARRFESLFARRDPRRTAEVVFAIGAIHVDASDWPAVSAHYRRFLQRYGDLALPHRRAQAHVLVARAHLASGQRDRARPELEAAVAIHAQLPPDALSETDRALLHDAASEALYELAEAARERFEALPFPTLRGAPSLARVNRWAAEELTPWLAQKLELLRVAEQAYERVHPLGIPRWRIASAARIGDMIHGLVERVRASPVPAELERDPELLAAYWEALDIATEPYLEVAVQRYEACLHTATAARWFDERTRHCEVILSQLDAARFPLASELRGRTAWEAAESAPPVALRVAASP